MGEEGIAEVIAGEVSAATAHPLFLWRFCLFVGLSLSSWYTSMIWARAPDRIPSTTPGAEPPRDAKDSGSARSHSTHLETSSSNRP